MFIHTRIKYSIFLLIPLILLILLPAVSFADDDKIPKENNKAIESLKEAIKIAPDNADVQSLLGLAYSKSGMYKEAIEAYKEAIRIAPDYVAAHGNLVMPMSTWACIKKQWRHSGK